MNSAGKCIWTRMAMAVFMASVARDCFCLARSTDERNVWTGLRQGLEALEGDVKTEDMERLGGLLKEAEASTNLVERQEKLVRLKEKLFSVDSSSASNATQVLVLDYVWQTASILSCALPHATDKDRWKIRMEALAWIRQQVESVENAEPEDKRTWPQKWGNVRLATNEKHNKWERLKNQMRASYAKNFIRLSAQCIEDDGHTEEFRAWARAEMEKVIGRPLTDDDLMFKDDVLRRRKARGRKQGQEPAPRGCPPTTRLNPQPLSGAWCLVSDAVC